MTQRLEALSAVADNSSSAEGRKAAGEDAGADRGEEQKMIRGMVERLAARLEKDKSDLQGWLMLIRSYAILKDTDKAQDAAATARQEFASDAKALEQIDALAQGLGLPSRSANGGQPKS